MTYREIAEIIIKLPDEHLDLDATVFDIDRDEFRSIFSLTSVENQVLDGGENHPVFSF